MTKMHAEAVLIYWFSRLHLKLRDWIALLIHFESSLIHSNFWLTLWRLSESAIWNFRTFLFNLNLPFLRENHVNSLKMFISIMAISIKNLKNHIQTEFVKSINSPLLSVFWFSLEIDNLDFKMKILKFLGIQPPHEP